MNSVAATTSVMPCYVHPQGIRYSPEAIYSQVQFK